MTLERRWLVTVVAFVAISVALEAAVGFAIAKWNAGYGAQTWLSNGKQGAHDMLVRRMFAELEREGEVLAHNAGVTAAVADSDPAAVERELEGELMPSLRKSWLVIDAAAPRPVRSGLEACDGSLRLLTQLASAGARSIAWCGDVPVLFARMPVPGTRAIFLGTPLGQGFADEVKAMSLNEIILWGPRGVVATSLVLQSGKRATRALQPDDAVTLSKPGAHFERVELQLDGQYAGYFPEKVKAGYALALASTGAERFDVFAYSAPLDEAVGPADLRIFVMVPADLLTLGPTLAGVAMVSFGIVVTLLVALLALKLIRAISRPLNELERAARAAAAGSPTDGTFQAGEDSGTFELSSLSSSFAAMKARADEGQRRAAQSEKMAALGQLAGGVAHEINNPLGVILGFAQGLERRVPEGDALRMPVMSIVRESLRCKALVQELLTFSRVSKKTDEPIDVAHEVSSSLLLLGTRAKTQGVEIVAKVESPLPGLRGSRTQLQQVLVNLGTNSLDAMKQGGTLTVHVHAKGSNIVIEVADTGCGIPEELQRRVFEPFFTTKPVGEGTGLGLSLVYQIAQQHHGRADLVSSGPTGTVIRVTVPSVAVVPPLEAAAVRPGVKV